MCKALSEIDKVYRSLKDRTTSEKLKYCIKLIEKTTSYIEEIGAKQTPHIKKHSGELIKSAQKEISTLAKGEITVKAWTGFAANKRTH